MYRPKKVGTLPIEGREEVKQTNEIGMFPILFEGIAIKGKCITADALLTQRKIATYLVERDADYHFTVKGNQAQLQADIALQFQTLGAPSYTEITPPDHGRIETRSIWCSTALNEYLDFPHVGQVFMIKRDAYHKKTGLCTTETVFGVTSQSPEKSTPKQVLEINRGHWAVESLHYMIDWNFNEDRSRIRTGYGPENVTRLRRFAIGILKNYGNVKLSIAEKMRRLNRNVRLVFDYLRMTANSTRLYGTSKGLE